MSEAPERLERSHIVLIALLSTATFFEGYDFVLLNLVLPYLRRDFELTLRQTCQQRSKSDPPNVPKLIHPQVKNAATA